MNNSKKILALLLTGAILLAGCNSNNETPLSSSVPNSSDAVSSSETTSSSQTSSSSEVSSSSGSESSEPQGLTIEEAKKLLDDERKTYEGNKELGDTLEGLHKGTMIPEDAIDIKMTTSLGVIELRLFPSEAPKAVENFVTHAKNGYYDGLTFHRVINDFMIQGGDPVGNGTGGESIWGDGFETEFTGKLFHFNGAISMANTGAPNSNGSQFFIVNNKVTDEIALLQYELQGLPFEITDYYREVGGTLFLDGRHPVFGYVTKGMDVVDAIAKVEKDTNDKPKTDVKIDKVEVQPKAK